ncbi:zinc finger domain-containing protein [Streptomyces scopuliridis]|uniref:zinc finger domain-containing protein n=1 Tax=Streptomyces scopuliridis TaxID=452529 RepID=UPI0035D87F22
MNRPAPARMPDSIRRFMGTTAAHPARGVVCPWCRAGVQQPCVIPSSGKRPVQVHQQRIAAWAQLTACCTTCQVTPEVPCHEDGRALKDGSVHAARYAEADRSAA